MTVHAPVPDYAAARQAMVDSQLRPQGVNDPAVISAMSLVPREKFVPEDQKPLTYADRAIPLGGSRALPSPSVLGLLLTALTTLSGQRALVIGAATGYSSAVLREMGVEVTAVESSADLAAIARKNGVKAVEGPLNEGWAKGAPYDLILVDGAIDHIPDALIDQLGDGGRLGGAIIEQGITRLFIGRRAGGGFGFQPISDVSTPVLPGFERPKTFTF